MAVEFCTFLKFTSSCCTPKSQFFLVGYVAEARRNRVVWAEVVFALSRRQLGQAIQKNVAISVFAFQDVPPPAGIAWMCLAVYEAPCGGSLYLFEDNFVSVPTGVDFNPHYRMNTCLLVRWVKSGTKGCLSRPAKDYR